MSDKLERVESSYLGPVLARRDAKGKLVVVRELERGPTVEDVNQRCLELMGDDQRTVGAIRAQLISEFGQKLFDEAAASAR
jgi:hypothetical protein